MLPDPEIHERFWGYVDRVVAGNDIKSLVDDKLTEKRYETILQGLVGSCRSDEEYELLL